MDGRCGIGWRIIGREWAESKSSGQVDGLRGSKVTSTSRLPRNSMHQDIINRDNRD